MLLSLSSPTSIDKNLKQFDSKVLHTSWIQYCGRLRLVASKRLLLFFLSGAKETMTTPMLGLVIAPAGRELQERTFLEWSIEG